MKGATDLGSMLDREAEEQQAQEWKCEYHQFHNGSRGFPLLMFSFQPGGLYANPGLAVQQQAPHLKDLVQ
jgi:hypothetical protein